MLDFLKGSFRRHNTHPMPWFRLGMAGVLAALHAGCSSELSDHAAEASVSPGDGMAAQPGDGTNSPGGVPSSDSEGGLSGDVPLDGYSDMPPNGPSRAPWTAPLPPISMLRKVKGVLTGLAPTDAELAAVTADMGALGGLIDGWMATPEFTEKMIFFFQNAFQQSSLAVLDFQPQLRKRPGAFDLPYAIFGDNAFPLLFKNMKESFARTALELIREGRPFNEVLTTQRFMMTTALKSLYMQIEMPYDIHDQNYKYNQGTRPPIEQTLDANSPNYLVFGYEPATTRSGRVFNGTCAGDATKVSSYPGNTNLFMLLLGAVGRDSGNNSAGNSNLGCMEHAAKPYFSEQDLNDWTMVTVTNQGTPILSYDLPRLRSAVTLSSRLPRVGYFTTPAFLATWNTNDSNQHRVTANQALLVALGQGYTSAAASIPVPTNLAAVNGEHAVTTSTCFGCHKSLDPMRQFWANSFDFNEKPSRGAGPQAAFAFGDVIQEGETVGDFGKFVSMVSDLQVAAQPVNRFALAMTQKLCFFANSSACEEADPEMRRIALEFQNNAYDFNVLVRQLFASPLVTMTTSTETALDNGVTISITRRDQLCAALSSRLERPDLCENAVPTPTNVTTAVNRLAGALPADGFSRGTEFPVTTPDPSLFFSAASELVCEAIAAKVVDAKEASVFTSDDVPGAIEGMVSRVMGVPPSDSNHAAVVEALDHHHTAALASDGATAASALRSTFSAACQAPTTVSFGI
jgi:hypothetical protein